MPRKLVATIWVDLVDGNAYSIYKITPPQQQQYSLTWMRHVQNASRSHLLLPPISHLLQVDKVKKNLEQNCTTFYYACHERNVKKMATYSKQGNSAWNWHMLHDVFKIVAELHELGIAHGNIRMENMFQTDSTWFLGDICRTNEASKKSDMADLTSLVLQLVFKRQVAQHVNMAKLAKGVVSELPELRQFVKGQVTVKHMADTVLPLKLRSLERQILLLGCKASGKSTMFTAQAIALGKLKSDTSRHSYKYAIIDNIYKFIAELWQQMLLAKIEDVDPILLDSFHRVSGPPINARQAEAMLYCLGCDEFWQHYAQLKLKMNPWCGLVKLLLYHPQVARSVLQTSAYPAPNECLLAFAQSKNYTSTSFATQDASFKLIDPPSASVVYDLMDYIKWFEGSHGIIYTISMLDYKRSNSSRNNNLDVSLEAFELVESSVKLANTPIFVVFTGLDVILSEGTIQHTEHSHLDMLDVVTPKQYMHYLHRQVMKRARQRSRVEVLFVNATDIETIGQTWQHMAQKFGTYSRMDPTFEYTSSELRWDRCKHAFIDVKFTW